jgi:hypothetical protein
MSFLNDLELPRYSKRAVKLERRLEISCLGNADSVNLQCEPQVANASRADTIQFLVHGISYDKNYWNGLGTDEYSWVDYATKQGYPTLAIDNLGNGESDHPDALLVTQQTIQVEIQHVIIGMLRAGTLPNVPKAFSKVLFVGKCISSP